ncbi:VPLPA-CTERM sorting domain-containing protein [Dinoroseobacter sp. S375]|uniref:VPLPA-CTERM sorting domain-containing protein n=1 Tax=Dinoroseobacter sp. S375 TaxID=3415136 RepID=UPI003C7EC067
MIKQVFAATVLALGLSSMGAKAVTLDLGNFELGSEIVSATGAADIIAGGMIPASFLGIGASFGPFEVVTVTGFDPFDAGDFSVTYAVPSTTSSLSGIATDLVTTDTTIEILFDVAAGNIAIPSGKFVVVIEDIDPVNDYGADPFGFIGAATLGPDPVLSSFTLTALVPIPLPAALPLLALGLGSLAVARRRKTG